MASTHAAWCDIRIGGLQPMRPGDLAVGALAVAGCA